MLKRSTYIIGVAVLLLLFFLSFLLFREKLLRDENHFLQNQAVRYNNQLAGRAMELTKTRNRLNQEITKTQVVEGSRRHLKDLLNAKDAYLESVLKDHNVKLKNLQSAINFTTTSAGSFVTLLKDTVIIRDSVKQVIRIVNYNEPGGWFKMSGNIKGDSMFFNPVFYNQYDIAIKKERIKKRYFLDLFPPKRTVTEVINLNPFTETTGLKGIVQEPRRRFLGIPY